MNPIKTTPKDFFLHLAATVVLYAVVIALANLATSIINYAFPDTLAGYFYAGSIAWPISMVVVLVPVLYVIEWLIKRDIAQTPEKQALWVRRWRIDLTIFLSVLVLIGDLVTLINTYISGEITERFVYKFFAILVIFGIVFAYYLLERMQQKPKTRKALIWIGALVALAAVVAGFMTVGSPYKQRALKMDSRRVSDLQTLQWQIVSYWQQKEKLPATLADLNDAISGIVIPKDPDTEAQYEYVVKGPTSFELCATFDLKNEDPRGRGEFYGRGYDIAVTYPSYGGGDPANENWKHEAGRTCFSRVIDPERYPPYKPVTR